MRSVKPATASDVMLDLGTKTLLRHSSDSRYLRASTISERGKV